MEMWLVAGLGLTVLVVLSAFFSGAETAIMTSGRVKLTHQMEQGKGGAEQALRLREKPGALLATILVGNNLVNVAAAALGTVILGPLWATVVVTLVLLVLAEVTPSASPQPTRRTGPGASPRPCAWWAGCSSPWPGG